uniref:Monocarboxylate transporter 9 n=1 Tax=Cacopsylla melanoneura TaxID=428564 RepID=A0A8D9EVM3_9HEMI
MPTAANEKKPAVGNGQKRNGATVRPASEQDEDLSGRPPPSKGPVAPDGGWGWVVVFASFMIHIVTDGVTYSFGILFKEFTTVFQEGDAKTAWIASLLVGVTLCSGPISSALVNKYGCRKVTIAGSILGAATLAVSVFAQNVITLCITIGFGTGLGFGLIYLPAIVSVTCYFERLRSLATGIAVCGSGLGTIIFAPVINYTVKEYGWKWTLLFLALVVLSAIFFGILFRPLEDPAEPEPTATPQETQPFLVKVSSVDSPDSEQKTLSTQNLSSQNSQNNLNVDNNGTNGNKRPHSVHGHVVVPVVPQNGIISNNQNSMSNGTHPAPNKLDDSRFALSQPLLWEKGAHVTKSATSITKSNRTLTGSNHGGSGLMHKKDILYFGSVKSIADHSTVPSTEMTVPNEEVVDVKEEPENQGCLSADTKQTLKEMLDMGLLKDPIFILFTISNIFTSIGFNVPYLYLVKLAEVRKVENGDTLLSIIGAANMVSRVVLGYFSDKPYVNRLYVYNSCLAICGLSTCLCALCHTYMQLAIYSIFFGSMIGAYVGLTSVILVDLLGLDRLTNAFGLLLLFQGIASLVGPPIAGFMFDMTQSYSPAFYMAGICIGVSGLMLFVIPSLQAYLLRRRQFSSES